MIQFPHCKINLGLSITNKRDDNFHNIDSVFYSLALHDALEFVESNEMKFETSGIKIPGNATENLVLKAYDLLKKDFPFLPNIHIHLHKNIPIGGGLGGGSSDAVFMLKMICAYFNLPVNPYPHGLLPYAQRLGSDCPFFIYNTTCHALGRGEILTPITLDLSQYNFVLIFPKIHINTAWAFKQIKPKLPLKSTKEIVQQPISNWKDNLINDFEEAIFLSYPLLNKIKENLYHVGAIYSAMSGSGSTMFGIINKSQLKEVKLKIRQTQFFDTLDVYFI